MKIILIAFCFIFSCTKHPEPNWFFNQPQIDGFWFGIGIIEKNKENFILEMDSTIRNLLKNEETTLLLQGYDFMGFSLWNQKTNEILRRKKKEKHNDLLGLEFQRDREFFDVLKNSLEFNMKFFKGLVEELDAN